MVSRRRAMAVLGAALSQALFETPSFAAVSRGLKLQELVDRSLHALRGMPLEAYSEWARIDDQRRIVTYTRVRVDEPIFGAGASELLLRTLGGEVGDTGQLVSGEARLLVGEPCVVFATEAETGILGVTGMAQGHYPLRGDDRGVLRLLTSPGLGEILQERDSAVAHLRGLVFSEARSLIQRAHP